MSTSAVIFDLDGTLVDSSPGILDAYAKAFVSCGLELVTPLSTQVIGPPLHETLMKLSGLADTRTLDQLTDAFKAYYDSTGYLGTVPFAGIDAMLRALHAGCVPMHIATNKRALPTHKIVEHLGWCDLLDSVCALDSGSPPAKNKGELLARLLLDANLVAAQTAYVGDRHEDGLAADQNGQPFIWVSWGFDNPPTQTNDCGSSWKLVKSPGELLSIVGGRD